MLVKHVEDDKSMHPSYAPLSLCIPAQGQQQFKQLQQQLSTVLKQANKRVMTKVSSLQKQMGSSEQCQAIQKQADMLMANIYR